VHVSCVLTVYLAKQARAKVAPYPRQASVAVHLEDVPARSYGPTQGGTGHSLIGVRSTASSCAIDVECVGTWPIGVTSRRSLLLLHQLRVVPKGSSVIG